MAGEFQDSAPYDPLFYENLPTDELLTLAAATTDRRELNQMHAIIGQRYSRGALEERRELQASREIMDKLLEELRTENE